MKHPSNLHSNANPVIISETDFNTLSKLVGQTGKTENQYSLLYELNRAIVVKKEAFPAHGIGINTTVSVIDTETNLEKTFKIVVPAQADIKKGLVSVLSPIGTALIGFRKGEFVFWKCQAV